MNNLMKSIGAAAFGLAISTLASTAVMAETWSLAHIQPADSSEGAVHQKFADLVKEYTNGELEINVFPASQLGATPEALQQLEGGVIQIFVEGTGTGNQYVDELKWISAPFLYDNPEHWQRFLQSGGMQPYFDRLASEHHITFIGDQTLMPRGPFRTIVTKEPFNKLADLQGLKLRMFESKFHIDIMNYLGATTIVLGWADVYEGLRNGVVDAVTSPLSLVEPTRFYEQAPNVARTDEYPAALAYMVNVEAWEGLSEENRKAVTLAYNDAAKLAQDQVASQVDETLAFFNKHDVNYVELDTKEFTAKMTPFYEKMVADGELPNDIWEAVKATR